MQNQNQNELQTGRTDNLKENIMKNFEEKVNDAMANAGGDTKMCKENLENKLSTSTESQQSLKGVSKPKFGYFGFRQNPKITGTKIMKAEFDFIKDKISRCKVEELNPNASIQDEITQSHINIVYKELKKYGHLYPLLLNDDNQIMAGNDIYEIALAVGLTYLPVVYESDLTLKEKCSYYFITFSLAPIADNCTFSKFAHEELRPFFMSLASQLGYDLTPYKP